MTPIAESFRTNENPKVIGSTGCVLFTKVFHRLETVVSPKRSNCLSTASSRSLPSIHSYVSLYTHVAFSRRLKTRDVTSPIYYSLFCSVTFSSCG